MIRINEKVNKLEELSRIGTSEEGYTICVYSGEGPQSHFHVYLGNPEKPDFECCIRIDIPEYFNHKPHMKELPTRDKKRLISYLKTQHPRSKMMLWNHIVMIWSDDNPQYAVSDSLKMPDYSKL